LTEDAKYISWTREGGWIKKKSIQPVDKKLIIRKKKKHEEKSGVKLGEPVPSGKLGQGSNH